ncbi:MAG TPA: hypothetical protein VFT58_07025, partial [Nitrososphaera sp.]|nr:hypothetical protein [Nitrososphaera sp.]
NVITGLLIAGLMIGNEFDPAGSWAMATAIAGIGIFFAAIAAVTAQIFESARAANSLAAVAIGVAFILRALGDGLATVAPDGLSASSMWLSWLSPFGWGQQMHPFMDTTWLPVGLYVISFIALVGTAFYLTAHRDVGQGILPARRGSARAASSLLSPLGLARRLQKGTLIGWGVTATILGAIFGVTAVEFQDFFTENEQFAEIIADMGGTGNMTDVFFSAMMGFMAFAIAAYGLQALLRARSEETSGHLEPVLATATSRQRWLFSHYGYVVAGIVLLSLLSGLAAGVAYVLVADAAWSEVFRLTTASLVQIPAILVLIGLVTAAFGLIPRLTIAVGWGLFAAFFLVLQFGGLLNLPEWTLKLSPFTHTPAAPADDISIVPLGVLLGVAVSLALLGFAFFRRRDLTTS